MPPGRRRIARADAGYFGVPFSNFMGWFLTVWVFLQLFALYLRRRESVYTDAQPEQKGYWVQATLCYGVVAMKFPLNILVQTTNETIADPTGVLWRTDDIYVTCGLVGIFTMFAFTALSLMRIAELPSAIRHPLPNKRSTPLPSGMEREPSLTAAAANTIKP